MEFIDQPAEVRTGEELNASVIETFLRDSIPDLEGVMTIGQFPGGHSNLTYLVTFGNKEMVLRRPPFGFKARTAHDMGREYRILKALKPYYPYCPEPLIYSDDNTVMDCPFYVMERMKGIILRKSLPKGLVLSPDEVNQIFKNVVKAQSLLHAIDYRKTGLENLGRPDGYVSRQVEGWSSRYRAARTPDAPDFESVMDWLGDNSPPDSSDSCIIHNDFKFDNIVLDSSNPLKITGILDWEMATIGDPLMDIGSSMGYWVQKDDSSEMQAMRTLPTHLEGAMTRRQYMNYYSEISGRPLKNIEFYRGFGLFRLAVIAQQIYYRFYHGQTSDKRFQMLIFAVAVLEKEAKKLMGLT